MWSAGDPPCFCLALTLGADPNHGPLGPLQDQVAPGSEEEDGQHGGSVSRGTVNCKLVHTGKVNRLYVLGSIIFLNLVN